MWDGIAVLFGPDPHWEYRGTKYLPLRYKYVHLFRHHGYLVEDLPGGISVAGGPIRVKMGHWRPRYSGFRVDPTYRVEWKTYRLLDRPDTEKAILDIELPTSPGYWLVMTAEDVVPSLGKIGRKSVLQMIDQLSESERVRLDRLLGLSQSPGRAGSWPRR